MHENLARAGAELVTYAHRAGTRIGLVSEFEHEVSF